MVLWLLLPARTTEFWPVKFVDVDLARTLLATLEPSLQIRVDPRMNLLMLQGPRQSLREARALLDELDHPADPLLLSIQLVSLDGRRRTQPHFFPCGTGLRELRQRGCWAEQLLPGRLELLNFFSWVDLQDLYAPATVHQLERSGQPIQVQVSRSPDRWFEQGPPLTVRACASLRADGYVDVELQNQSIRIKSNEAVAIREGDRVLVVRIAVGFAGDSLGNSKH